MKTVWIAVTADKYQLPIAVADTARELAEMRGTTTNNVISCALKTRQGKMKPKYLKIEIEED